MYDEGACLELIDVSFTTCFLISRKSQLQIRILDNQLEVEDLLFHTVNIDYVIRIAIDVAEQGGTDSKFAESDLFLQGIMEPTFTD